MKVALVEEFLLWMRPMNLNINSVRVDPAPLARFLQHACRGRERNLICALQLLLGGGLICPIFIFSQSDAYFWFILSHVQRVQWFSLDFPNPFLFSRRERRSESAEWACWHNIMLSREKSYFCSNGNQVFWLRYKKCQIVMLLKAQNFRPRLLVERFGV